jgi:predicted RNase H-like nuclease (RuvC/YqgF family)
MRCLDERGIEIEKLRSNVRERDSEIMKLKEKLSGMHKLEQKCKILETKYVMDISNIN